MRKDGRQTETEKALKIIEEYHGLIRTSQAIALGIHPRALYALRDSGELMQLTRGVYCLPHYEFSGSMDLEVVAVRIPKAVVCLVSALAFHEMTTHIPHTVSIAIPKSMKNPILEFPPIEVYHFSKNPYETGIEYHEKKHVTIAVYDREKTIIDCFKFRNTIGLDIAIEALKTYRQQQRPDFIKLIEYARICRVEKVMTPYLEMLQ